MLMIAGGNRDASIYADADKLSLNVFSPRSVGLN